MALGVVAGVLTMPMPDPDLRADQLSTVAPPGVTRTPSPAPVPVPVPSPRVVEKTRVVPGPTTKVTKQSPPTTVTKKAPPTTVTATPDPIVVTTTETPPPAPTPSSQEEDSVEDLDLSGSQGRDWSTDGD